jgi:hypothetical protein
MAKGEVDRKFSRFNKFSKPVKKNISKKDFDKVRKVKQQRGLERQKQNKVKKEKEE